MISSNIEKVKVRFSPVEFVFHPADTAVGLCYVWVPFALHNPDLTFCYLLHRGTFDRRLLDRDRNHPAETGFDVLDRDKRKWKLEFQTKNSCDGVEVSIAVGIWEKKSVVLKKHLFHEVRRFHVTYRNYFEIKPWDEVSLSYIWIIYQQKKSRL